MPDQRTVRCEFQGIGTTGDLTKLEYVPDEGWFVDEVLPAFASNGAGVVFVLRPLPGGDHA